MGEHTHTHTHGSIFLSFSLARLSRSRFVSLTTDCYVHDARLRAAPTDWAGPRPQRGRGLGASAGAEGGGGGARTSSRRSGRRCLAFAERKTSRATKKNKRKTPRRPDLFSFFS